MTFLRVAEILLVVDDVPELDDEIELEQFTNSIPSDDGAVEYIAGYITRKV